MKFKISSVLVGLTLMASFGGCVPNNYKELMDAQLKKNQSTADSGTQSNERLFSVRSPVLGASLTWYAASGAVTNYAPVSFNPVSQNGSVADTRILLYATTLPKQHYGKSLGGFDMTSYITQDINELGKTLPNSDSTVANFYAKDISIISGGRATVMHIQDKKTLYTTFRAYVIDDVHDAVGIIMLSSPVLDDKEYAKKMMADYLAVIQSFKFEGVKKQ